MTRDHVVTIRMAECVREDGAEDRDERRKNACQRNKDSHALEASLPLEVCDRRGNPQEEEEDGEGVGIQSER